MSIPGQADPGDTAAAATQAVTTAADPSQREVVAGVIVICLILAGIAVLVRYWRAGVLSGSGVVGPDRAPDRRHGWPTLVTFFAGVFGWVGTQAVLSSLKQARWAAAGNQGRFQMTDMTAADLATFATLPGVIGVVSAILCLHCFPRDDRPRLGASLRLLPRGLVHAVGAVVVILPLIIGVGALVQLIYKLVEFSHPSEHDLLRAMNHAPAAARWTLIAGAVLVAPLVEELLFRGLFQTLLLWAANQLGLGHRRPALARWFAVLVASFLFAIIHEPWSAPMIFVLSLCLGYAYERTGNFWLAAGIHALFNGAETLLYLTVVAPR